MKTVLVIAVPLIFLGLLVASMGYVAHRLQTLFGLEGRWPVRIGVAVAVVGAMVAMIGTAKSTSAAAGALNVLGGWVIAFHLFLLFALLGLQVIQLWWSPPSAPSGVAVLAVAFAVTAAGALRANSFEINETEVRLPGLGREVTVMEIADVHLGHHRGRAYLAKIVEETNRLRPDVVLIAGDLIDAEVALEPGVLDPLSGLKAPAFFVGGNHETYVDQQRAFELVARQGVRVLHDEVVEIHGLQLVGLDFMNEDEESFDLPPSNLRRTIRSVLAELPLKSGMPSLLMHHSPVGARYVAAKGIGLMISGHTHAGQVFPFTLVARLFFRFNRGLHRQGATAVFVSQGAGTFGPRVRLGTSNEINLLRLKPAN